MRKVILLLTTVLAALVVGAALPGTARAGGGDTAAVAVNTKDGSSVFKLAFAIKRVMTDVVDNTNAAVAFASCNSCQTVAISIQVVLIMDDASTITPTNLALAYNYMCNSCETFASAYQWVLSTGGPVHFTAEGNREVAQIMRELRDLRDSGLSIEELQARVAALMQRLARVLQDELVAAGKSGAAHTGQETTTAPTTTRSTTTEPTVTILTTTEPTTTAETTTGPTTTTGP